MTGLTGQSSRGNRLAVGAGRRGVAWWRWRLDVAGHLLALPAALLIAVSCVLPLGWGLFILCANTDVWVTVKPSAFGWALLARTVGFNAAVAVIATVMSLPVALVLGRGRGMWAKVLWALLPAALLMPSLSYAYGWSQFVRLCGPVFEWLGIRFVPAGPADVARCIWTLAAWLWPVPAGLIGLALRRMDPSVQLYAMLDGALWRITLRQLAGPIIASLAIVTLLATQEFSVYEPTGISVVATEVRMVFETGAFSSLANPIAGATGGMAAAALEQSARAAAAIATAIPLLVVTAILAAVAAWGATRTADGQTPTVGKWPRALDAPAWASAASVLLILLTIGVPVLSLVMAMRAPLSASRMLGEFGPQLGGTFLVAGIVLAVAGGVALSSMVRWTPGILVVAGMAFLVGGQLLAIAMIRIYNRPGLFWAYDAYPVPVLAYLGRFGWLALAGARGTWSQSWRELRQMAALDGAGAVRTAVWVVLPVAWPTLLAGAILVAALSLTEVPATVLLQPQHPQVLTPMLMTWVHMARFDPMIEAALLMMASVTLPAVGIVVLLGLARRVSRRVGTRR